MAFKKFQEYLNGQNKMDKVKVSVDGDTGPTGPKKPEKAAKKGKNWHVEGAQVNDTPNGSQPVPYSAPGTDPGLETADGAAGKADPLGKKGDTRLIYKPKVPDQALRTSVNNKTEQFLSQTGHLNAEQYANYILRKNKTEGTKQIIETVTLINENDDLIEALVREIKRNGNFSKLVESLLNQPELYSELAINLCHAEKGKEIARQIAKAINETTAQSASEDTDEKPAKKLPKNDSSINTKGQPVAPENNARTKGPMLQPEHHLIEALSNYKPIKMTMKKIVNQ